MLERTKRSAWLVATTATARAFDGEVLTLGFTTPADIETFKRASGAGEGVSDLLRSAIQDLLGVRVKFLARVDGATPPVPERAGAESGAPVGLRRDASADGREAVGSSSASTLSIDCPCADPIRPDGGRGGGRACRPSTGPRARVVVT